MKTQVLDVIGELELKQPAEIRAALEANDRLKYYFSLLQIAASHADNPEQETPSLRTERLACGVDNPDFDEIPGGSERQNGRYRIPRCARLLECVTQDLRIMAAPAVTKGDFAERCQHLLACMPAPENDWLPARAIGEITRAGKGKSDSIHQLVMDLHKALLGMQDLLAEENVDGASVYHIEPADRVLIRAFMTGVNRTAPLKFNHPGLATTATRAGTKLVIQNDIGETDAHVMVVHVEGMCARLTYSDVHLERLQFLRDMLASYTVAWETEQSRQLNHLASGAPFYLVKGCLDAKTPEELLQYLEFLGSRLVFLIDWNRARKQLRGLLRGPQRLALLAWAAGEEVGHCGFLEAGGARLINDAIEQTAGSAMHFGDRLSDVLGDDAALDFLRFVLRSAAQMLRDHQSPGLLRDRIRAELQAHFSSEGKRLLELANEHAGLIFEIASQVRDAIRGVGASDQDYAKLAKRARRFEHDADELVAASREAVRRRPEYNPLFRIVEAADDAADELEEAAFLLGLLVNSRPSGEPWNALGALADLLVAASQEWIKALTHAIHTGPPGAGQLEEAGDFLTAIDSLLGLEHQADDAERALTFAAVQHARGFRQLHLYSRMARGLEEAADALKAAGLIARDYLLGNVLERGL